MLLCPYAADHELLLARCLVDVFTMFLCDTSFIRYIASVRMPFNNIVTIAKYFLRLLSVEMLCLFLQLPSIQRSSFHFFVYPKGGDVRMSRVAARNVS